MVLGAIIMSIFFSVQIKCLLYKNLMRRLNKFLLEAPPNLPLIINPTFPKLSEGETRYKILEVFITTPLL